MSIRPGYPNRTPTGPRVVLTNVGVSDFSDLTCEYRLRSLDAHQGIHTPFYVRFIRPSIRTRTYQTGHHLHKHPVGLRHGLAPRTPTDVTRRTDGLTENYSPCGTLLPTPYRARARAGVRPKLAADRPSTTADPRYPQPTHTRGSTMTDPTHTPDADCRHCSAPVVDPDEMLCRDHYQERLIDRLDDDDEEDW